MIPILIAAALSLASTPAPGPVGDVVTQAALRVHDLAVTAAGSADEHRWAVWSDGAPGDMTTRLALLSVKDAKRVWSMAWPHAYGPTLRPTPEWSFDGQPVLAVTFQYGAAAQELELYGLDRDHRPVHLAEKLANAVGWTMSASGERLLVLYDRPASALVPACYGWNTAMARLGVTKCPN